MIVAAVVVQVVVQAQETEPFKLMVAQVTLVHLHPKKVKMVVAFSRLVVRVRVVVRVV
jgi:hypothetical protein